MRLPTRWASSSSGGPDPPSSSTSASTASTSSSSSSSSASSASAAEAARKKEEEDKASKLEKTLKNIEQKRLEEESNLNLGMLYEEVEQPKPLMERMRTRAFWSQKWTSLKRVRTRAFWAELWQKTKEEVHHYKMGFKLLWADVRISSRLLYKVLRGGTLTRRERRQFVRTGADLFRLVPFSVFIIVPGAELLLPFAIKIFPNLLPRFFFFFFFFFFGGGGK